MSEVIDDASYLAVDYGAADRWLVAAASPLREPVEWMALAAEVTRRFGSIEQWIIGTDAGDALYGKEGNDIILGLGDGDFLLGGPLGRPRLLTDNDVLMGGQGDDTLIDGFGHNAFVGGGGADLLQEGLGVDLFIGGPGPDTFRFGVEQSTVSTTGYAIGTAVGRGARDIILDFQQGSDVIDLGQIHFFGGHPPIPGYPPTEGDLAFTFIGSAPFTAGGDPEVRYEIVNGQTIVQMDTGPVAYDSRQPDGIVDAEIQLRGVHILTANDFVL